MEQQLRLDNPKTALDLLSNNSMAKIHAAEVQARAALVSRLSEFWDSTAWTAALLLAHEPAELIPEFENYATSLYEVMACELRPYFLNAEEFLLQLPVIEARVVKQICPHRNRKRSDLAPPIWIGIQPTLNSTEFGRLTRIGVFPNKGTGDWEKCMAESFASQFSRLHAKISKANPEASIESQKYRVIAVCKYQQYLRTYANWQEFAIRVHDHLSRREDESNVLCNASRGLEDAISPIPGRRGHPEINLGSPLFASKAEPPQPCTRKADIALLLESDGKLKGSVSFAHAGTYLDVSLRHVQRLAQSKTLATIGGGHNRQITVASLLAYLPPKTRHDLT